MPDASPGRGGTAFARYWAAAAISSCGTAVTTVAMPVLVVQSLEASAFEVGVVSAAQFVPYAVLGLVAGVYSDRWPRKRILVWGSLGRAVALGAIPLLWAFGVLQVWALVTLLLAFGACSVFAFAATQSLLPASCRGRTWSGPTRAWTRPTPQRRPPARRSEVGWSRWSVRPWPSPSTPSATSSTPRSTQDCGSRSPRRTGPPPGACAARSAKGCAGPTATPRWGRWRCPRTRGSSPTPRRSRRCPSSCCAPWTSRRSSSACSPRAAGSRPSPVRASHPPSGSGSAPAAPSPGPGPSIPSPGSSSRWPRRCLPASLSCSWRSPRTGSPRAWRTPTRWD